MLALTAALVIEAGLVLALRMPAETQPARPSLART
jgi:hypothetical protein